MEAQEPPARYQVSIHAPARGATERTLDEMTSLLFQSTHPRGVRHDCGRPIRIFIWFQSTHPRGVRRNSQRFCIFVLRFQSTHPRGVRLNSHGHSVECDSFQSTHPRGVRRYPGVALFPFSGFNPRTREGCDPPCFCRTACVICFNPRTREGCDLASGVPVWIVQVSIHAPARGATYVLLLLCASDGVSIHAPARGATGHYGNIFIYGKFQSTHPRGVRRDLVMTAAGTVEFQSTHPRGVRHFPWPHPRPRRAFQSTHPRGVRQNGRRYVDRRYGFNPRTREGCDRKSAALIHKWCVSIHAPARGATRSIFTLNDEHRFQSTHPRGVRPLLS